MTKRLYKVYHLPKYTDDGEDSTLSEVSGLGKTVVFEVVSGKRKKRDFYTAWHNYKTYQVYSHEENIELSLADALRSIWEFDAENQYVLLKRVVRKVIRGSNLASTPLTKEKFQEYLDGIERLPDTTLKKIENDEFLSDEENALLTDISNKRPFHHGWTLEEVREADQMIDMKLGIYDANQKYLQKVKAEKRRKYLKRILLVLFLLLFVGVGSSLFVQFQNRRSRTGKVTSSLSPTIKPTEDTASPNVVPTERPTKLTPFPTQTPTKQPTQIPTEQPTELTLLPSKAPTHHPTQTPTEEPIESTPLPSKAPTQQPTRISTEEPTKLTLAPSHAPTNNPTQIPTQQPTYTPIEEPTKFPSEAPTDNPTRTPTKQPSTRPTTSPSKRTSSNPTISPLISPTKSPSLQQISRLSCEEIRKSEGATEGNFGKNNFEIEIINGNRYCGDTYGGQDPERPNRNKWSVRSGRRDCPTYSFEEGFNICDSVGARWCSVEELELLVGKGTGCGGDEQLIYSNSDCEVESGLKGKIKFAPGSQAGKFPNYKCEIDLTSESLVRCCGDI